MPKEICGVSVRRQQEPIKTISAFLLEEKMGYVGISILMIKKYYQLLITCLNILTSIPAALFLVDIPREVIYATIQFFIMPVDLQELLLKTRLLSEIQLL